MSSQVISPIHFVRLIGKIQTRDMFLHVNKTSKLLKIPYGPDGDMCVG